MCRTESGTNQEPLFAAEEVGNSAADYPRKKVLSSVRQIVIFFCFVASGSMFVDKELAPVYAVLEI